MHLFDELASLSLPVEPFPLFPNVSIVRGDLIHPVVSGNKVFKLAPHVQKVLESGVKTIASVGGRYSNHLHALAWVGHQYGLKTIGVIRSFQDQPLTPTLLDCQSWGMRLQLMKPSDYERRYSDEFWEALAEIYPGCYFIREGGLSDEAIASCAFWWRSIPTSIDVVVLAVGSGTTFIGLIKSAPKGVKVIGIPVYRDPSQCQSLRELLVIHGISNNQYELWLGHAGKGFGRASHAQKQFAEQFVQQTNIKLDLVYNAKVFHALHQRLEAGEINPQVNIAVLHTGGLQGLRS